MPEGERELFFLFSEGSGCLGALGSSASAVFLPSGSWKAPVLILSELEAQGLPIQSPIPFIRCLLNPPWVKGHSTSPPQA